MCGDVIQDASTGADSGDRFASVTSIRCILEPCATVSLSSHFVVERTPWTLRIGPGLSSDVVFARPFVAGTDTSEIEKKLV